MVPDNFNFGGGAAETVLNPLVAVWLIIAVLLILTIQRKKVAVPLVFSFFMIPLSQVVVLGGLHFPALRILILAGLLRAAFSRGDKVPGGFNSLDGVIVLWTISAWVVINLQWMDSAMLVKSTGDLGDALGGYLAVRFLISDVDVIRRTVKVLAVVCVIQGLTMIGEQFTQQNVFVILGALPSELRNGHVRSSGVMGTLGSGPFAGVLIPMFLWLRTEEKSRILAYLGFVGAMAMAYASHASTAWMAVFGSIVGLAFWPLRKQMRLLRLGIAISLVVLHLVMHGPVWSLIAKIDLTGGSSSYHRYMLVDNCIRHFSEWWLLGTRTYTTWGWDTWDLCNQFVVAALTGGLVTLILYVMIFKRGFALIGTARKRVEGDRLQEWRLWCLGAFLFANLVVSFGINYMLQLQFFLSTFLACISVACCQAKGSTVLGARETASQGYGMLPAREWGQILNEETSTFGVQLPPKVTSTRRTR